jgi:hypothetical protein
MGNRSRATDAGAEKTLAAYGDHLARIRHPAAEPRKAPIFFPVFIAPRAFFYHRGNT